MLLYSAIIWSPIFKFLPRCSGDFVMTVGNLFVAFRGCYVWTLNTASTPANTTVQVLVRTTQTSAVVIFFLLLRRKFMHLVNLTSFPRVYRDSLLIIFTICGCVWPAGSMHSHSATYGCIIQANGHLSAPKSWFVDGTFFCIYLIFWSQGLVKLFWWIYEEVGPSQCHL